jgi:hypothetical protein
VEAKSNERISTDLSTKTDEAPKNKGDTRLYSRKLEEDSKNRTMSAAVIFSDAETMANFKDPHVIDKPSWIPLEKSTKAIFDFDGAKTVDDRVEPEKSDHTTFFGKTDGFLAKKVIPRNPRDFFCFKIPEASPVLISHELATSRTRVQSASVVGSGSGTDY